MIVWLAFDDARDLAERLAATVAQRLREGLAARGRASLVVPGGRSPLAFFERLSQETLDWPNVHVGVTDDRCVPPGAAKCNAGLVRDYLLQGPAAAAQFVPLDNGGSHALSALPRPYDVIVLGMGIDGHMASLFPGAANLAQALDETAAPAVVLTAPPSVGEERVSLNLAALLETRHLAILVPGPGKKATYERARGGASPLELPIAAILRQRRVSVDAYATSEEPSWPA